MTKTKQTNQPTPGTKTPYMRKSKPSKVLENNMEKLGHASEQRRIFNKTHKSISYKGGVHEIR